MGADQGLQSPGEFDQNLIAGRMPEAVVNGFEMIHVDDGQIDLGRTIVARAVQ